ncbi:MAG: hypothetical protein ACFFCW_07490, partial [Candidatus Hodarchaeota archaeon]
EMLGLPPIERPVAELEKIAQNTGLKAFLEEHERIREISKEMPPIEPPAIKVGKIAQNTGD